MFVVSGVSGNTGSVVAKTLLAYKQPVRVLVRSHAKGEFWRAQGAEVALGDVENADSLAAALHGASGAYMMLPPDLSSNEPMVRARRLSENIASAVERSGVRQVTLLSSVGADLPSGNGIVQSLHIAEQRLSQLNIGLTIVRAAYFMENWLSSVPSALASGVLYTFNTPADGKVAMVATQDIGAVAAYSLIFGSTSHRLIELAGPVDLSPEDVAAALSRLTGRPIATVVAPIEGMAPMLTGFGMAAESANEMAGLTIAINAGRIKFGGHGGQLVRGTTSIDHVLAPAIPAAK